MQDFFDVKVITIADLRADQEGVFISQLASLICEVFSRHPGMKDILPPVLCLGWELK